MNIKVQKNSPVPIYHQIKEQLKNLIAAGELKPGDALPSESIWAKELGISRMTMRAALTHLVNEGEIIRHKGRGTFIAPGKTKVTTFESKMFSLTELLKDMDFSIGKKILEQNVIASTPLIAQKLNLTVGSEVISIISLRFLNDNPALLEYSYYPTPKLSWLTKTDLENRSVYSILKENGTSPWQALDEIELGLITDHEAELLNAPSGMPVLKGSRTTWEENGEPIEFYQTILRGDYYKLEGHLKPL